MWPEEARGRASFFSPLFIFIYLGFYQFSSQITQGELHSGPNFGAARLFGFSLPNSGCTHSASLDRLSSLHSIELGTNANREASHELSDADAARAPDNEAFGHSSGQLSPVLAS